MPKKKPATNTTADKTTTYSTRLNDDQREHLEQAASLAGVSASRFIRDATLRAAADVVNSSEPNDRAITAIAQRLADSILNQQAKLEYLYEDDSISTAKASLNNGFLSFPAPDFDEEVEIRRTLRSIHINSLSTQDARQLKAIAESCPFTFSQAFLKAMLGANEPVPQFTPKSNPNTLISD